MTVYMTSFTVGKPAGLANAPSEPLPFETFEECADLMVPDIEPYQKRDRWWLFDLGDNQGIALSDFRFM